MSILAAAADFVSDGNSFSLVPWGLIVLVALGGAAATGLFRAGSVSGPYRLPLVRGIIYRLVYAACIACFTWFFTQAVYFAVRRFLHPGLAIDEAHLRAEDWAFLSTIPPLLGFAIALAADIALLGGLRQVERLGLQRDPLPGAARGLLGIVIASPMIWFVSSLTEAFYEAHHFVHPQEHELLKVMGDTTNPVARTALIIGAVIIAPLFEETIFRAHVQTFLRELLCRMSGPIAAINLSSPGADSAGTLTYARPQVDSQLAGGAAQSIAWQTWTAIVLASALFTSVHPRWMWPPIFFLAICLGYAYERTGSLWTSIVMHSLFNATSTYLFLSQTH